MAVFCSHLANKSEQREIIQCMPVNYQVHITKKLRATFTVLIFFFFCSQRLALDDFKMLSK